MMIIKALQLVWKNNSYRWISAMVFLSFLFLYLVTLPSAFTGGHIGLVSMQFLNATMVFLALIMSSLVALIMTLIIWLIRLGKKSSTASATSGVILGIFSPILCCSPIIPILFASLASIFPSLIGASGPLFQGFIATHQNELFAFAILLLILALYQNAKNVIQGGCCKV